MVPPTLADIERWVSELGNPQFEVREQATQFLGQAGVLAIKPLQGATLDKHLEVSVRAVRALRLIYESAEDDAFEGAEAALEEVSNSRNLALARRAVQALTIRDHDRQRRAILRIQQLGGEIRMVNNANSRTINNVIIVDEDPGAIEQLLLGEDWKGGDEGLKYVRRVSRIDHIYVTPGSKITTDAILALQTDNPTMDIQMRGSAMMGISCDQLQTRLTVSRVQTGSGAEAGGLLAGDVIVKFEGNEISDFQVVIEATKNRKVGEKLTLEIERDGTLMTKVITLGKWSIKDLSTQPQTPSPVRRQIPIPRRQTEP